MSLRRLVASVFAADGYSVIVAPRAAMLTPALTVVTPVGGFYEFDAQVYAYEGAIGAPMDLGAKKVTLAFFDGTALTQPDGPAGPHALMLLA